jgi:itaconate CoA-transferase
LQHEGGQTPKRIGLAHPSISPYGVFKTRDGVDVLISIQNDREWVILARDVMGDAALAADPDFATNLERVKRRPETDGRVAASFASMNVDELTQKLIKFDIAFGRVSDPEALRHHPHLRRITIGSPTGPLSYPAPAAQRSGEPRQYGPVPALGEHSAKIRTEFGGG